MGEGDDTDDLWKAVNGLRAAVADLTGLVREVRAMLNERCDVRAKKLDDHEARMRAIEHRVWWASGAASVLSVIVSVAIGWISKHFGQ